MSLIRYIKKDILILVKGSTGSPDDTRLTTEKKYIL